jgi:hypothetical protein
LTLIAFGLPLDDFADSLVASTSVGSAKRRTNLPYSRSIFERRAHRLRGKARQTVQSGGS